MFHRARVTARAVAASILLAGPLLAGSLLTAPAAEAAPAPIKLTWQADATTAVKKLNQQVVFPSTSFTATIRTDKRTIRGPLQLPPAKTSLKLGRLDLVTITMEVAAPSPVRGTITYDGPVWTIKAKQDFEVHITRIAPLDSPWVNLVRKGCTTSRTTATLGGTVDFSEPGAGGPSDYTMSGSYAIPKFSGCGLLVTPLLNSIVAGPDNPLSVHFTA